MEVASLAPRQRYRVTVEASHTVSLRLSVVLGLVILATCCVDQASLVVREHSWCRLWCKLPACACTSSHLCSILRTWSGRHSMYSVADMLPMVLHLCAGEGCLWSAFDRQCQHLVDTGSRWGLSGTKPQPGDMLIQLQDQYLAPPGMQFTVFSEGLAECCCKQQQCLQNSGWYHADVLLESADHEQVL